MKKKDNVSSQSFNPFVVGITGARPGDRIIGNPHQLNTKGSSMTLVDALPPLSNWLNPLTSPDHKEDWIALESLLSGTNYFKEYNPKDIGKWLLDHKYETTNSNVHIYHFNVRVKDIVIGGEDFNKYLDEKSIERLVGPGPHEGGFWKIRDIYNMCINNKISKNRDLESKSSGVLMFRPELWCLQVGFPKSYDGPYIHLSDSIIHKGNVNKGKIFLLHGIPYAIISTQVHRESAWSIDSMKTFLYSLLPSHIEEIDLIMSIICKFHPGFFKSLLQKVIRTSCTTVTHDIEGIKYSWSSKPVIAVAFGLLVCHPGDYNSKLRVFISGAESAFKRAAVMVLEDAWCDEPIKIVKILCRALLCKQYRGVWFPSTFDLIETLNVLWDAHLTKNYFSYNLASIDKKNPPIFPEDLISPSYVSYVLLKECGSFSSDINLFGLIYINKNRYISLENVSTTTMPLIHAVDQHSNPDFVYCFEYDKIKALGFNSFSDICEATWQNSSKYNPRYGHIFPNEKNEFIRLLRVVQERIFKIMLKKARIERKQYNTIDISGEIPETLICGMVGQHIIKAKNKTDYLVTIDPHDLGGRVVMLNPKGAPVGEKDRNKTSNFVISDNIRTDVINTFNLVLSKGIKLTPRMVFPYNWLKGGTIYYREGEYKLDLGEGERSWNDYLMPLATVPIIESVDLTIDNALLYSAIGCEQDWESKIYKLLETYDIAILYSLRRYISTTTGRIDFPNIDRKGNGAKQIAHFIDLLIVELLSRISLIVPVAIHRTSERLFKSSFVPMLKIIDNIILDIINRNGVNYDSKWSAISDKDRSPMPQQVYITERLSTSGRLSIICSDVGTGKTKAMLDDVTRRISEGDMPPYLLYFTVASGIETAEREALLYGLKPNILIPTKPKKMQNMKVLPYVMNIINYNQTRLNGLDKLLIDIAPSAYAIFDEFDTVVNPTIKTYIALEVARRVRRGVCCSATPVKDKHLEYLIPWLSQVVSFPVYFHNIWTAMAAMITGVINIDIEVIKIRVLAQLSEEEQIRASLLSAKGSRMSPTDFRLLVQLYYEVCFREQLNQTLKYIKNMPVFLVLGKKSQLYIAKDILIKSGELKQEEIAIIGDNSNTTFIEGDGSPVRVIMTTTYNTRAYTATKAGILIDTVFFVSEAVRIQTLGRIRRTTQLRKEVIHLTIHAGILTQVLERYDRERSMVDAARSISAIIGSDLLLAARNDKDK